MKKSLIQRRTVLFAWTGLFFGFLYSFGGFFIDLFFTLGWITSAETSGLSYGTLLAFLALIGMPFLFGLVGLLVGSIETVLRRKP